MSGSLTRAAQGLLGAPREPVWVHVRRHVAWADRSCTSARRQGGPSLPNVRHPSVLPRVSAPLSRALACPNPAPSWEGLQVSGQRRALHVCRSSLIVRPYTVRSGDTLFSICRKRGFELSEVLALNHGLDPEYILEGQTILLPAGALSSRDKEILSGIGPRSYRTYPVRAGETAEDIARPRKIFMEELEALNPGVDLTKLTEGQVIKLPPGKYTVREREMLAGTAGAPDAFFASASPLMLAGLAGAAVGAAGAYVFLTKFKDSGTSEDE